MTTPMTTSPADHNQQLLGYLAVWQQLLEQTMALLGGLPGMAMPGVMPSMPTGVPFAPPQAPGATHPTVPISPTDYAQQLFGYLQTWRQYLEQAAAAPRPPAPTPGPAQPPVTYPATTQSAPPVYGHPSPYQVPDVGQGGSAPTPAQGPSEQAVPPGSGQFLARSEDGRSTTKFPPDDEIVAPVTQGLSQVPVSLYRLAAASERASGVRGPGNENPSHKMASRAAASQTIAGRTDVRSPQASLMASKEILAPARGEGLHVAVRPMDFRGVR
jgi:hypothetical protein